MAATCLTALLSARPANVQVVYTYHGNPFILFCGAGGLCSSAGGENGSYTATDHVEATLILNDALTANLPLQNISQRPGHGIDRSGERHPCAASAVMMERTFQD